MRRWLLLAPLIAAGCSRAYWRTAADADVYPIIAERQVKPEYAVGDPAVTPPPASRLHDPFDPDRPPKPPDDPSSARFMARPNGIRGYRKWERDGVTPDVELNPGYLAGLCTGKDGAIKLTKDSAFELALLHSRDYQLAREQVYAQALGLTLNRFDFELQWAAGLNPAYTRVGNGGLPFESNTLNATGLEVGFTRNLYAGGQLLTNFANSFVFEYTGGTSRVLSNFTGSLIQPLLRGFGRDVRLEGLVLAERQTLYAVRSYARFRKLLWADVTTNDDGYLGLLLALQQVRNARFNLRITEENFRLVEAQFRSNRKAPAEYDQTLINLLDARQEVINSDILLQNSLDRFKVLVGLPPRVPVELDDSPLERFVLVAPELEGLQDAVQAFLVARGAELDQPPPAADLGRRLDELAALLPKAAAGIDAAEADVGKWADIRAETGGRDADPQMRQAADAEYARTRKDLPDLREELAELRRAADRTRAGLGAGEPKDGWEKVVAVGRQFQDLLTGVAAVQTRARTYLIRLPAVDRQEAEAVAQAKADRLDLQNALGAVTDAWRQVRVAANALQSDLNLTIGGNLGLPVDAKNPFEFNANNSALTAGLQFNGPLNRRVQRNAYRLAVINYHAARRNYMLLADTVEQQIRFDLRTLGQTRANFEISRQQLLIAARQLLSSRRQQNAPVPAGGGRGASAGDTLLLLQAQAQLLAARNRLTAFYIGYEQRRIRFLLDLEALQLDDRGVPTNDTAPDPAAGGRRDAGRPDPGPDPGPAPAAAPAGPPPPQPRG